MNTTQLKRRLNKIAADINALVEDLREQHGEGAYLYFEAEGQIHAMLPEESEKTARSTLCERQSRVIATSNGCKFDCGAW